MGTWKDYIDKLKNKWVDKTVEYEGERFKVVNVDINAGIWIDKPHYYCETYTADHTAVDEIMIKEAT